VHVVQTLLQPTVLRGGACKTIRGKRLEVRRDILLLLYDGVVSHACEEVISGTSPESHQDIAAQYP
jgi:hypothetical protein